MNRIDKMTKSVVKIVTEKGMGTGFFFVFQIGESIYPFIITNKHVVENCNSMQITISKKREIDNPESVAFKLEDIQSIKLDHSKHNVDICAIPAIDLFNDNFELDIAYLTQSDIRTNEIKNLNFVEDVLMVGYPRGVIDNYNNLPVFRKGITATHPGIKFRNQKEFLVDMTITNGSSGSPVYLYNPNGYTDRLGNSYLGQERFLFLGINYADHIIKNKSNIYKGDNIDNSSFGVSEIGINLGVIIHAEELLDFEKQIKNMEGF